MNDMEQKQREALNTALEAEHKVGALPDDALDTVVGGAILSGPISLAMCKFCGWHAAFDQQGKNDERDLIVDHILNSPDCEGKFVVYDF